MVNNFKKARLIAGITQNELARRMNVTPGAVCHWETGRTMPDVAHLQKLAGELNTTVEKLLDDGERVV